MRNKLIMAFALWTLLATQAFAGNFIKYDPDTGRILQSWHSIDPVRLGIDQDPCLIRITYEEFKALSKYSVVKNKKLTEMDETEKSEVDAEEAAALAAAEEAAAKEITLDKIVAVLVEKSVISTEEAQDGKASKEETEDVEAAESK